MQLLRKIISEDFVGEFVIKKPMNVIQNKFIHIIMLQKYHVIVKPIVKYVSSLTLLFTLAL